MKHKLALLICALALLIASNVAPVYAGDDGSDCIYSVGDAACSSGGDTGDRQIWSG